MIHRFRLVITFIQYLNYNQKYISYKMCKKSVCIVKKNNTTMIYSSFDIVGLSTGVNFNTFNFQFCERFLTVSESLNYFRRLKI